jgi:hypothetical protein
MTDRQVNRWFWLSTLSVSPFWLLMILFPRWSFTRRVMKSLFPIILPASVHAAYAALLIKSRPEIKEDLAALAAPTPDVVLSKMAEPDLVPVSWLHMLPADLFIGRWTYFDSQARGISPWLASSALFLIGTSGSIGFLIYLLVRFLHGLAFKRGSRAGAR